MPAIPDVAEGIDGDDGDGDDGDGEMVDGDGPVDVAVAHMCGALLVSEDRVTRNATWTEGWRIVCPFHGRPCGKYRAKHLAVRETGPSAALYFLGAWVHGAPTRTSEEHSRWSPGVEQVHEFMRHADCP